MNQHTELEVFYDGDCPICSREIAFLRSRSPEDRVTFIDINSPQFNPDLCNKSKTILKSTFHARKENGEWLMGMEVMARLYGLAGFHRLERFLNSPPILAVTKICYRIFARYRPTLQRCKGDSCNSSSR